MRRFFLYLFSLIAFFLTLSLVVNIKLNIELHQLQEIVVLNTIAISIIVMMFLQSSDKKKSGIFKKPTTNLEFEGVILSNELLIAEIYDNLRSNEGIIEEEILFFETNAGYLIQLELKIEDGTNIGKIKSEVKAKIEDFVEKHCGSNEGLKIEFKISEVKREKKSERVGFLDVLKDDKKEEKSHLPHG